MRVWAAPVDSEGQGSLVRCSPCGCKESDTISEWTTANMFGIKSFLPNTWDFLVTQMVKNLFAMKEIWVRSLGWAESLGERNGYLLQYSSLENPMDRGAWWSTVHGVANSKYIFNYPVDLLLQNTPIRIIWNMLQCEVYNVGVINTIVLIWQGCRSKIQETGWLKQRKFIFSQFWRKSNQYQSVGSCNFSRGLPFCLECGYLLTLSSHILSSLCILGVPSFLHKAICLTGLQPTHITSFCLDYLLKRSLSKYSHNGD